MKKSTKNDYLTFSIHPLSLSSQLSQQNSQNSQKENLSRYEYAMTMIKYNWYKYMFGRRKQEKTVFSP